MSAVPWVCGACRSINQPRESRCYRCRTPRDLGEVDPEQLITAGAGSKPEPTARPVGAYRSSATRAVLAQVLIVAALAATVVSSFLGADLVARLLDGGAFDEGSAILVGGLGLAGLALGGLALVAWAAWLSRVVDNVPTLGLGWPNVTPRAAIYESIIPVVNLYRVPSILRDVVKRLDPNGPGEAVIAAAWLALVGGVVLPRALRLATSYAIGDVTELARVWVVVGQVGLGLTVAGGALLIVLIHWMETRLAARARGVPEPAAPAPEPVEPPVPTRAQTIGEAAGVAAARPEHAPTADPDPMVRPRWGGAVASPSALSARQPSGAVGEPHPVDRHLDPDDLPVGEDHSLD